MRFQLILFFTFISFNALAVDDKSIQDLFHKYELVMDQKKTELIEEVFTEKFIQNSGGKAELIQKIKELKEPPGSIRSRLTWKRGRGNFILARFGHQIREKSQAENEQTEFIIMIRDSKPKIDGTLSDAD
jgi:hypothetical protein